MTFNDLLKRIDIEKSKDKMILFSDGIGWTNVWFEETDTTIIIKSVDNAIFSSDK